MGEGDEGACAEVAEGALALGGGEVGENFLFVGLARVFGEETEEGLGGCVRLDICAPAEDLTACGDEFTGLVVAPDCGPAALCGAHEDLLVAHGFRDAEEVENVFDFRVFVLGADADCAAHDEVDHAALGGVIGDIDVEVVGALLGTGAGELPGVEDRRPVYVVRRVRLDEIGWVIRGSKRHVDCRCGDWLEGDGLLREGGDARKLAVHGEEIEVQL